MCLFIVLIVCETMFKIGESGAISHATQNNKWLEILAGKDFPPKLLWRTLTKQDISLKRRPTNYFFQKEIRS